MTEWWWWWQMTTMMVTDNDDRRWWQMTIMTDDVCWRQWWRTTTMTDNIDGWWWPTTMMTGNNSDGRQCWMTTLTVDNDHHHLTCVAGRLQRGCVSLPRSRRTERAPPVLSRSSSARRASSAVCPATCCRRARRPSSPASWRRSEAPRRCGGTSCHPPVKVSLIPLSISVRPSTCPSVPPYSCPSIHPFNLVSIHLCRPCIHLSIPLSIRPFIPLSISAVRSSLCPSLPSVHPSVHLCRPFIPLSIHPSVHPSVRLSVFCLSADHTLWLWQWRMQYRTCGVLHYQNVQLTMRTFAHCYHLDIMSVQSCENLHNYRSYATSKISCRLDIGAWICITVKLSCMQNDAFSCYESISAY